MEKIHIRANLIVSLRDGYTNSTNLKGVVSVKSHNGVVASVKADGCFVFINCPKGLYKIFIEGSVYQPQSFDVLMDDTVQIRYVTLMPSRKYPFAERVTRLYGEIGGEMYLAFWKEGRGTKYLGRDKEQKNRLKIFFEDEGDVIGRQFCIVCHDKYYVNTVVDGDAENMWYVFEDDFPKTLDMTARILPVYRCEPDREGKYYLPVRGDYDTAYVIENRKKKGIEIRLVPDESGCMNLDWKGES